jgi:hypothetical protein
MLVPVCSICVRATEHKWGGEYYLYRFKRHSPVPKECEGCGRPVYEHRKQPRRKVRVFCCENCAEKLARESLIQARANRVRSERQCDECGETFTPDRSDAKFCSVACKQKAYRKRVTDTKTVAVRPIC